jgi:hypothetical protein
MSPVPPPLNAADYDAIEAAVMETRRGRWFLAEYARRNRSADTEMLLAAIRRLADALDVRLAAAQPASPPSSSPEVIATTTPEAARPANLHAVHTAPSAPPPGAIAPGLASPQLEDDRIPSALDSLERQLETMHHSSTVRLANELGRFPRLVSENSEPPLASERLRHKLGE